MNLNIVCFEGCYADYIETLQNVVNKTMTISSVGMCQEMCSYENIHKFAVKVDIRIAKIQFKSVFCINQIRSVKL